MQINSNDLICLVGNGTTADVRFQPLCGAVVRGELFRKVSGSGMEGYYVEAFYLRMEDDPKQE
jgi:hypothetical protein